MKYTTATDVKAYPSVPDTANADFIDLLINRASAYIDKYTGRKFGYNPAAVPAVPYEIITDEPNSIENWGGFYLRNFDVKAITSVKVGPNNTVYTANDYTFDALTGRFYIGGEAYDQSYNAVKVSYTYGYNGIPDDIKFACEQLVIAMYLGGATNTGEVVSERTGNYQVNYASPSTVSQKAPAVMDILKEYRILHI